MTRPRTFDYYYDDLPLVIDLGKQGGFIAGRAEIEYTDDVWDFSIVSVELQGEGKNYVPADGWLALAIRQRLEGELSHKVEDAIRDEIEEQREYAADQAADYRREAMWEPAI